MSNSFAALPRWAPFYTAIRAMPVLERVLMRGFATVRDASGAEFGLGAPSGRGRRPEPDNQVTFSDPPWAGGARWSER